MELAQDPWVCWCSNTVLRKGGDNNDSMRGMRQWEPDGNGMERVGIGSNQWDQVGGLRIIKRDTSKWKWKLRLRKTLTIKEIWWWEMVKWNCSEIGWGIIYEAGGWEQWIPSECSCSLLGLPKCWNWEGVPGHSRVMSIKGQRFDEAETSQLAPLFKAWLP